MEINKHLQLLGMKVKDKVTGVEGVVTTISFDLFGCIQAIVDRGLDKDGKRHDSMWFDVGRLNVTDKKPVMQRPSFEWTDEAIAKGEKGPAEKPKNDRY